MNQGIESLDGEARALAERILGLDLTYQNAEGEAYRQGHAQALTAQRAARAVPPSAREALLEGLTATLTERPAALHTAAWILGLPTPSPKSSGTAKATSGQSVRASTGAASGKPRRVTVVLARLLRRSSRS